MKIISLLGFYQTTPICATIKPNFGSSGYQSLEETGKVRCKSGAVPQL